MASPVRGVSFLNAVMVTGGAEMIVVVTLSGRGKRKKNRDSLLCAQGKSSQEVELCGNQLATTGALGVLAWWGVLESGAGSSVGDRDSGVGRQLELDHQLPRFQLGTASTGDNIQGLEETECSLPTSKACVCPFYGLLMT